MEKGKSSLNPEFYKQGKKEHWQGRVDGTETAHLRWHQAIKPINLDEIQQFEQVLQTDGNGPKSLPFVLLGFACDEGVRRNMGRMGAKDGPGAIRKGLSNLPIHHPGLRLFDAGNIICPDQQLEEAQQQLGLAVNKILTLGGFPIVLGGGHEVTFGHYLGYQNSLPKGLSQKPSRLGIINLDAHFDNREPGENGPSSGSGFYQIEQHQKSIGADFYYLAIGIQKTGNTKALFDRANQSGTIVIPAEHAGDEKYNFKNHEIIQRFLADIDQLYLTIDLDVFASAYAPGVSAPTPLGLIPNTNFFSLLNLILQSGKLRSVDFAELNPSLDQDMRTAKLAAVLTDHLVNQIYDR